MSPRSKYTTDIKCPYSSPKSKYTTEIKCPYSGNCLCCLNLNTTEIKCPYSGNCLCCLNLNILQKINALIQVLFMFPKSKLTIKIKCPYSGNCLCCLYLLYNYRNQISLIR